MKSKIQYTYTTKWSKEGIINLAGEGLAGHLWLCLEGKKHISGDLNDLINGSYLTEENIIICYSHQHVYTNLSFFPSIEHQQNYQTLQSPNIMKLMVRSVIFTLLM